MLAACGGGATPSPSPSATPAASGPASPASQAPSVEPGTLPTPEQTSLNIGVSVTEMSQFAGILAAEAGIFEKNGITVEYSVFEGDARVAAALQAGQVDIGFSGTSSAISSQLTDTPYDVVAVNAVILTDDLVCQSGIDTAEEVVGKSIAISTFGGTSNAAALLALKALELSPTDAAITQVGGQGARLAALQGGSIDCAVIDSNIEQDMIDQGFAIAVNLKDAQIPFGRSGMSMLEEFIAANPNTVLVAVASVLEAQNMIFDDPASIVPIYAEFTGLPEEDAQSQVEDFTEIGNRSLMWTEEALVNAQKAIAVVNPDIIDVDVADAGDPSFLQTLVDIGYYEKIGSPVP
ncbi:MAG TPA: ABC transporter substrate-binding protein [Candidatus Limnocylindrales bacterium]|nr:ABC transporter substrate-binding protein [Candidatus Limnocylindrales bacterium]